MPFAAILYPPFEVAHYVVVGKPIELAGPVFDTEGEATRQIMQELSDVDEMRLPVSPFLVEVANTKNGYKVVDVIELDRRVRNGKRTEPSLIKMPERYEGIKASREVIELPRKEAARRYGEFVAQQRPTGLPPRDFVSGIRAAFPKTKVDKALAVEREKRNAHLASEVTNLVRTKPSFTAAVEHVQNNVQALRAEAKTLPASSPKRIQITARIASEDRKIAILRILEKYCPATPGELQERVEDIVRAIEPTTAEGEAVAQHVAAAVVESTGYTPIEPDPEITRRAQVEIEEDELRAIEKAELRAAAQRQAERERQSREFENYVRGMTDAELMSARANIGDFEYYEQGIIYNRIRDRGEELVPGLREQDREDAVAASAVGELAAYRETAERENRINLPKKAASPTYAIRPPINDIVNSRSSAKAEVSKRTLATIKQLARNDRGSLDFGIAYLANQLNGKPFDVRRFSPLSARTVEEIISTVHDAADSVLETRETRPQAPDVIPMPSRPAVTKEVEIEAFELPKLQNSMYERMIAIAADSSSDLRASDVYRVLSTASADDRSGLAEYIMQRRPELSSEVADSLKDIREEATPKTVAPPVEKAAGGLTDEQLTEIIMRQMTAALANLK